jgi:hypothetical protein
MTDMELAKYIVQIHNLIAVLFGRMLLERSRRRWDDNKKLVLTEVDTENMKWVELAQDYVQ